MGFSTSDTIVAIATPPGRGGIGVVRVSGPAAHEIGRGLTTHGADYSPRVATFTRIRAAAVVTNAGVHTGSVAASRTTLTPAAAVADTRPAERALDHAVVTYFPAPHSYTGEDVMELSAHGSPAVLRAIVAAAVDAGARAAEPGEFTLRAFLNGRLDLLQAEAVADLVDAVTPLQARIAFDQLEGTLTGRVAAIDAALFDVIARLEASVDFPDEGYQFADAADTAAQLRAIDGQLESLCADARVGRIVREGAHVSIVGRPNVGKSSVFNALLGVARAIVTDTPGTTRDLVSETVDLDGLKVTLVDTAGLRETSDRVEALGVELARQAQAVSDVILTILDRSESLQAFDQELIAGDCAERQVIVVNKCDLPAAWSVEAIDRRRDGAPDAAVRRPVVAISATSGFGVQDLRSAIVAALDRDDVREHPGVTNVRHAALVERARTAVGRAIAALDPETGALPEEFVLADLQEARGALEEIVGRRAPEDLLAHIFARFCIGK